MKFINTSGLSLLGPGSEWFWTAVSGMALAITFIAIYRQLRLQASPGAREQLDQFTQQWMSERMTRMRIGVYQALLDGTDVWNTVGSFPEDLCNFWESVGTLARQGHLNLRVMNTVLGTEATSWWAVMGPEVIRLRAAYSAPDAYEDFEWLVTKMSSLNSGTVAAHVKAMSPQDLQERITYGRARIALEESLRGVRTAI